ncbi:hypothetical protein FSP39_024607 [Pinctada imbricata]|uniref:Uncharacterized protein n=1 Tax=Pinctada imbricata TaxID=66713 RepID=A0AA88XW54_PINIB|nr:hypothetical protein FSP39_024607 [Pinctada imbricata]
MNTSLYDKRDDFNISITNFPFLSSNIPSSLVMRARRLSTKLLSHGYVCDRLTSSLRKFYGRYGELVIHYNVPLSRMADVLQDFGFDLLSIDKVFHGGHQEITVKLQAPPDTQHYWSLSAGLLPVLDQDRFSSVEKLSRDGLITSRLHTTEVDAGYIYFKAFTMVPLYRGIEILLKSDRSQSSRNYSHTCAFALPSHTSGNDKVSVQTTFRCGLIRGQDTSESDTGIRYSAMGLKRGGTVGVPFASFTSRDGNVNISNGVVSATKTITKDRSFIDGLAGALSLFEMKMDMKFRDTGPLYGVRMFMEDDKSFDGSRNNPFLPGVFAEWFFTINHGALMAKRRQSYIHCKAIGYKAPEVKVYKVASDGTDIPITYPKLVHNTKFSTAVYYIINYPTEKDAGKYVCRTRVDGMEKSLKFTGYYEPEVAPEFVRSRSGIVYKYYSFNIQLIVKSPEDVSIACFIGSRTGSEVPELDTSDSREIRKLRDYKNYLALSDDEVTQLLLLCVAISPDKLMNKVLFQSDAMCGDRNNEFYEITAVQNRMVVARSIVIGGQTKRVNKIMTFKMVWLRDNYLEPMQELAGELQRRQEAARRRRRDDGCVVM